MFKLIAGLAAVLFAASANAGIVCADRYADAFTANLGCELGSTNNDSELQVNYDLIFGYDDWSYVWKSDDGAPQPGALDFTGALQEGTFTLEWGTPPTGDVLFVLKDGAGDPDTYVAWLVDPGSYGLQDYSYTTPFLNTNSGNGKDISHAAFYYRQGGPETRINDVPVPGTLWLFGSALLGLVGIARNKVTAA